MSNFDVKKSHKNAIFLTRFFYGVFVKIGKISNDAIKVLGQNSEVIRFLRSDGVPEPVRDNVSGDAVFDPVVLAA